MSGSSIGDLLTKVKSEMPAMPWTTKTPILSASLEKAIMGSITLMTFSRIFFCPPLGVTEMAQLKLPTSLPTNFTFNFLVYSGLSFTFSFISMPFPSMWQTTGCFD